MSTRIPRRLAAIAILAVGATVLVSFPPPPTIAQSSFTPTAINAALCEKGESTASFIYTRTGTNSNVSDAQIDATLEAQCKALVDWRNAAVSSPGGSFTANSSLVRWGQRKSDNTYLHFFDWPGVGRDWTTPDRIRNISPGYTAGKGKINGPVPALSLDSPAAGVDDTLFDSVKLVALDGYSLTGSFPAWIYRLRNINYMSVAGNLLSGSINGPAFLSTSLQTFLVNDNSFSGSLPDFDLARTSTSGNANLNNLRFQDNNFSGPIPGRYQHFSDGRPMMDFSFGNNNLSGDIPAWIGNMKWRTPGSGNTEPGWDIDIFPGVANYRLSLANNRLCLPDGFTMETLLQTDGNPASVQVSLNGNICPREENVNPAYIPPRVSNIDWSHTDPPGATCVRDTNTLCAGTLTVTWNEIEGHTANTRYTVDLSYRGFFHARDVEGRLSLPELCRATVIGVTTASINASSNEGKCGKNIAGDRNLIFDPTRYTAAVSSVNASGRTYFVGKPSGVSGWHILTVHTPNNIRTIGQNLGINLSSTLYSWDTTYQRFRTHPMGDSNLPSLSRGDALIIEGRPAKKALETAGVGSADTTVSVSMSQGWNLLSAGGDSTRGTKTDTLFFIDNSLLDCDQPAGVIAVMRYDSTREGWSIALPCHPSVESNLIGRLGSFYTGIGSLSEYDNLYIYFASPIPVDISWDCVSEKYVAAAAARACTPPDPLPTS